MERIKSLDLARGFTVIFIAPIHVMLLFSKEALQDSSIGIVFKFIAEGPGAQLFMLLMGIHFYLFSSKHPNKIIKRALAILSIGYLLNILKFVLPYWLGLLSSDLIVYL